MKKFNLKKAGEAGSLMVEAIAMLGLMSLVTPVIYKKSAERMTELQDINAASQMRTISTALDSFIKDHYKDLTNGTNEIGADKLEKYLPAGTVVDGKIYSVLGGEYKMSIVKTVTEDMDNAIGYIGVSSDGETEITPQRAARIATMVGSNGGVVGDDKKAYGVQGVWEAAVGTGGMGLPDSGDDALGENSVVATSVSAITPLIAEAANGTDERALHRFYEDDRDYNYMHTTIYGVDAAHAKEGESAGDFNIKGLNQLIMGSSDGTFTNVSGSDYKLYVEGNDSNTWLGGSLQAAQGQLYVQKDVMTYTPSDGQFKIKNGELQYNPVGTVDSSNGRFNINSKNLKYIDSDGNAQFTINDSGKLKYVSKNNSNNMYEMDASGGKATTKVTNTIKSQVVDSNGNDRTKQVMNSSGVTTSVYDSNNKEKTRNEMGTSYIQSFVKNDADHQVANITMLNTGIITASVSDSSTDKANLEMRANNTNSSGQVDLYIRNKDGKKWSTLTMDDESTRLKRHRNKWDQDDDPAEIQLDEDGIDINGGSGSDNHSGGSVITTTHDGGHIRNKVNDGGNFTVEVNDGGNIREISKSGDVVIARTSKGVDASDLTSFTKNSKNLTMLEENAGGMFIKNNSNVEVKGKDTLLLDAGKLTTDNKHDGKVVLQETLLVSSDESTAGNDGKQLKSISHADYKFDNSSGLTSPTVLIRKGAVEIATNSAETNKTADTGTGYVLADRFVVDNATNDPRKVYGTVSGDNLTANNGLELNHNLGTVTHYDHYMVDPAYTSVMHDIKLTSRGGARLSDILPDFINKGIYVIDNSYYEGEEGTGTGARSKYASAWLGKIPAPQCPPGYAKVITISPAGWRMAQIGTLVKDTVDSDILYLNEKTDITINNDGDVVNTKRENVQTDAEGTFVNIPEIHQANTWLKSAIRVRDGDTQYNPQEHVMSLTNKENGGFYGWDVYMGFVYSEDLWGHLIDEIDGSQTHTGVSEGGFAGQNEGSSTTIYWNLFPVDRYSLEGYATVYCYFDRMGLTNLNNSGAHIGSYFDSTLVDTTYNQLGSSSVRRDPRQGSSKKNSTYTNRLRNPKLKYNYEW